MRPGFGQFNVATTEYLQFAAQFGATDVLLNTPVLPGAQRWELVDLVKLRVAVEQYKLTLTALENVPPYFYDHIMLNGPRRDEQIENMIYTVRNIARAGIPIFGYNWMPSHVWRTPPAHIRGGAVATAYDHALGQQMPLTHDRDYSEEEMWANLEYWIKIITPIAEEEGIRLGIHPCDPPVPVLGGLASGDYSGIYGVDPELVAWSENYRLAQPCQIWPGLRRQSRSRCSEVCREYLIKPGQHSAKQHHRQYHRLKNDFALGLNKQVG